MLDRCQGFRARMLPAPDLHSVARAWRAILAQMRHVARDLLQATITLEAPQRTGAAVIPGCQEAAVTSRHTRTMSPETVCGAITIPVRTFHCRGGGATVRPDGGGAAASGGQPLCARGPGVARSSDGAQGSLDRTAEELSSGQAARETRETEAVGNMLGAGDGGAERRVAMARDGGTAHIDGRGQPPQVATLLVRRLATQAEEPTLGVTRARRYVCGLGPAEALAVRVPQAIQEAGWERLPIGESGGDGTPWIGNGADADVPGGRQTLDDAPLSAHRDAFAQRLYPNNAAGATAWVDQQMGALLTDHVGEVRGARKRLWPWNPAVGDALAHLIGEVEHHRTRLRYQAPWPRGLAVGSGAVEGACKPIIHRRFKRVGMRCKQPGFLNVLALRITSLNGMFEAFRASRGLPVQASVAPTK